MEKIETKHGFVTTVERSNLMRKIKGKNTKPEIALRKELWSRGHHYRLNVKSLPGKPDIVIRKYRIAIFVDGEFWHGYKWKDKKARIKSNRNYWIPKIEGNMVRDRKNNGELRKEGWLVIRFWENEIKKNIGECIEAIINEINKKGSIRHR